MPNPAYPGFSDSLIPLAKQAEAAGCRLVQFNAGARNPANGIRLFAGTDRVDFFRGDHLIHSTKHHEVISAFLTGLAYGKQAILNDVNADLSDALDALEAGDTGRAIGVMKGAANSVREQLVDDDDAPDADTPPGFG